MPYKINPFTGNPDYYDASTGGTVTSITAGNGLSGGTITTSGTIDIDGTKVPYYALGPSAGLVQWNGSAWVIDATNYVNKAGDTMIGYLTLNADPSSALHAATKQYVDNVVAAGINFHAPVFAATAAPLPSVAYSNGAGGVGATLIATAPGALTIDTVSFTGGERVLIKDQVSGLENGIYVVSIAGDALTPFQLTRATDADNSPSGELDFGDFCFVEQGPTNGGFGYILNTTGPITVGTTALSYVIFNAAQVVTAGTGLTELPTNTLNIDITKVPYYGSGFSPGFAKWDGINWIFDNSTYLDTTTAASTYLTQVNAAATYYPLTNPAGYITSASLSGYVPYTLATNNVDLGAFQLSTSQLNISTKGTISSSGTNTLLVNNTATDGTTKVQFNGTDILELKGASSVSTITNFRYTNPNSTNQVGPISSMIIDPGTRTWTGAGVPNGPLDVQKEIEILSPIYQDSGPVSPSWDGTPITLYVNAPTTNTTGVGYSLGLYGHFKLEGDATDYPGGTYLDIGSGDGTTIGFTGAKLSFFGNPPIVQPTGITTVQGLSDALSNLGLISPSTIVTTSGTVTSVDLTTGTTGIDVNVSGSPITSSGSITLNIPSASATARGLVTTTTQTFGGAKTFSSAPIFSTMTIGSILFAGTSGTLTQDNTNFFWDDTNKRLGIGMNTPAARIDIKGKVGEDIINIVNSSGTPTFIIDNSNAKIAGRQINSDTPTFTFIGATTNGLACGSNTVGLAIGGIGYVKVSVNALTLRDATNIVLDTTTGTKIGTATTQKLGFFNAAPIVQPSATTSIQGIATALSNLGLIASSTIQVQEVIQAACSDENTAITVGTAKVTFRMPYAMTLTSVRASLSTAQTSGTIFTIDVNQGGVSIFSTRPTIDNGEKTTTTAATPSVLSTTALTDDAEITVDVDQIGDSTAKGLKITLIGYRT